MDIMANNEKFWWIFGGHWIASTLVCGVIVGVSLACMDDGCPAQPDRTIAMVSIAATWLLMSPIYELYSLFPETSQWLLFVLVPANSLAFTKLCLMVATWWSRKRRMSTAESGLNKAAVRDETRGPAPPS